MKKILTALLPPSLLLMMIITQCQQNGPTQEEKIPVEQLIQDFDSLWIHFDELYPYFQYKSIDWNAAYNRVIPGVETASTYSELTALCVDMLRPLRDFHIYFQTPDNEYIATYQPDYHRNYNLILLKEYLQDKGLQVFQDVWGYCFLDSIPYVVIYQWDIDRFDIGQFDTVFERFKSSPAMIIDVRMNNGGNSSLADAVAERFTDKVRIYQYCQRRNGPGYSDFTELTGEYISPRGPWLYHRPVALLCGRDCMSSTEHFINAMAELPHIALIGDTTAGAKGNPVRFQFQDGTDYWVPRFIYYRTDMTVIEWNGIPPDLLVKTSDGDFMSGHDPVLDYALQWTKDNKAEVLPESTPSVEPDTIPPVVITTNPENNAQQVDPDLDVIQIGFSEFIHPSYSWCSDPDEKEKFPEVTGNPCLLDPVTACLPVQLEENREYVLWLNYGPYDGFKDIAGNALLPYRLTFRTGSR